MSYPARAEGLVNIINHCNWGSWYCHKRIGTRTGRLENIGTGEDCQNYSILEIGQNTEKSHGDLRILAVTQTVGEKPPAKVHVKNCQELK